MPIEVEIQTLGGLAGYGGRLKRSGTIDLERLAPDVRHQVEALFDAGGAPQPELSADALRYRLTREGSSGTDCIEVNETDLPEELTRNLQVSVGPPPKWPANPD